MNLGIIIIPIIMYSVLGTRNCMMIDYKLLPAIHNLCPIDGCINDGDSSGTDNVCAYRLIGVTEDNCCSDEQICQCCKYINENTYPLGCPYYGSVLEYFIS